MGNAVGALVLVGFFEGALVVEGNFVGYVVGTLVADVVEVLPTTKLVVVSGPFVGSVVGTLVGYDVGSIVGILVGNDVGLLVGLAVGLVVGFLVVGFLVGEGRLLPHPPQHSHRDTRDAMHKTGHS